MIYLWISEIFYMGAHEANAAHRRGFVPKLVSTLVPFPSGEPALSYVIANTLVTSEKAKTAKYHYNLRVCLRHNEYTS